MQPLSLTSMHGSAITMSWAAASFGDLPVRPAPAVMR